MKTVKNELLFVLLFSIASIVQAQKVNDADVPQAVKTTFKSKCPQAASAKWEKEDGNYEAHYSMGKMEMTCVINPAGVYVQSETAINASELPKPAADYLQKKMPGQKVTEAAKITDAAGKVTYEAEVKNTDYTFYGKCNFLKQEADND